MQAQHELDRLRGLNPDILRMLAMLGMDGSLISLGITSVERSRSMYQHSITAQHARRFVNNNNYIAWHLQVSPAKCRCWCTGFIATCSFCWLHQHDVLERLSVKH